MTTKKNSLKPDEQAVFALRELYERYGYSRYKMSRFEEYDLYVNNKDFLVSDEIITFTDRSGRLLALKPDVTLSIIKNAPDCSGSVQKVYYNENVYRVTGGSTSFREILQTGLECVGDLGAYEIAEVVLLAVKSLALISDRYLLDLSHMGLISAILEQSGLSPAGTETALGYLREKNSHEMAALCKAEGLSDRAAAKLTALVECSGAPDPVLSALEPLLCSDAEKEMLAQLRSLCSILTGCGFGDQVQVDFSVGNDLKYYSGVVFKGYIEGLPAGILSGGQYDKLLKKMGRKSCAIGFALYMNLLERLNKEEPAYSVDTVLLHDPDADPALLIAAAEQAAAAGSVLVTTSLPQQRTWRRLLRLEHGKVMPVEEHG